MGHHKRKKHKNQNEQSPPADQNPFTVMNFAALFQVLNSLDINQISALLSQIKFDPNDERNILREGDPRINLLNSLKPFLPPDRANIIDEVIRMFSSKQNNQKSADQAAPGPFTPNSEAPKEKQEPLPLEHLEQVSKS